MKKFLALASALLAMVMLAGCAGSCAHGFLGGPPSTDSSFAEGQSSSKADSSAPAQYGSSADYKQTILDARNPELNEIALYDVVTGPDDKLYADIFSETFGFNADDYERYAINVGNIITISYGVAIILPKEGREQAVMDQLRAYKEQQEKAMENYLQPQYEIAQGAIIKTAPTGEVLFAMSEDAEDVIAAMEAALAAGK